MIPALAERGICAEPAVWDDPAVDWDAYDLVVVRSASIYACLGNKEALFRQALALYGQLVAGPPRHALHEQPTPREAIHEMLRANADAITQSDAPAGCMLMLCAPGGGDESATVRAYLADLRREMFEAIRDRLARGVEEGDLTKTPEQIDTIARFTPPWCKANRYKPATERAERSWRRSFCADERMGWARGT